jgi:hypothetical protein
MFIALSSRSLQYMYMLMIPPRQNTQPPDPSTPEMYVTSHDHLLMRVIVNREGF